MIHLVRHPYYSTDIYSNAREKTKINKNYVHELKQPCFPMISECKQSCESLRVCTDDNNPNAQDLQVVSLCARLLCLSESNSELQQFNLVFPVIEQLQVALWEGEQRHCLFPSQFSDSWTRISNWSGSINHYFLLAKNYFQNEKMYIIKSSTALLSIIKSTQYCIH